MEPVGKLKKLKDAPPVPIKTYKWEDIRREKKRGKYPYTYLFKGPYIKSCEMEDEGEKKAPVVKKKVRKVKKIKKVSDTPEKEKEESNNPSKEEVKSELLMQVEQLVTEETEITEIKLKEQPETESSLIPSDVPAAETISPKNVLEKTADESGDISTENLKKERSEDKTVSNVETKEMQEIEAIAPDNDKINLTNEPTEIVIENKILEEQELKLLTDTSSRNEKSIAESEDTYTESNIEQYLDKEEVSKSISDASCLEATTSNSDVELLEDTKREMLNPPSDKKRKHSNLSEVTKSNLSLFEKIKNTKFKTPTFKILKFKKTLFSKKPSKRIKSENVQKNPEKTVTETKQTRKSESPKYIYIPLNPTEEELEQERQAKLTLERSLDSTNGNGRFNDTNGTAPTTSVSAIPETGKRKAGVIKTDKKSPPFKKKGKKKTSPKSENKISSHDSQKRGDSPVEYIHIPLTGPLPPELQQRNIVPENNENITDESIPPSPKTEPKTASMKGSHTGAVRKEPKHKKIKNPEYKLAKDIKKLASKLKNIQRKNKKILSIKKPVVKDEQQISRKKSITEKKRGDSPVEYIHIPLTGPLPEEFQKTVSTKNEKSVEETLQEKLDQNEEAQQETTDNNEILEKKADTIDPIKKENVKEINTEKKNELIIKTISPKEEIVETMEESKDKFKEKEVEMENLSKTSEEQQIPTTPSTGRSIDSILRMTGSSLSLENQKYVKIEKEGKKGSFLERMKISKKHEKKVQPIKQPEKEIVSPSKNDSVVYPGLRHKDSIVEYIHIPLKADDSVVNQNIEQENEEELKNVVSTDISSDSTEIQTEPSSEKELQKIKQGNEESELKIKTQETKKAAVLSKGNESMLKEDQNKTEKNIIKKFLKTDKEKSKDKKGEQSIKSTTSPNEKNIPPVAIRREDSIVEYIHIPLNPTEEELAKEKEASKQLEEIKTPQNISVPVTEKPETKKPVDSSIDPKKSMPPVAIRREDSIVEYIHIPLNPTEDELAKEKEESKKLEESKSVTKTPDSKKSADTASTQLQESKMPTNISVTKTPETKKNIVDTAPETEKSMPPVADTASIQLEETKTQTKISLSKKPDTKKKPENTAKDTEARMPPVAVRREDSVIEYIHIPLNPTEEELAKEKEENKQLEESKSITKTSEAKKKSAVTTSSQLEENKTPTKISATKKPDAKKKPKETIKDAETRMPPVAVRREDSIVEYIHIPLNPTEEELAKEKEENKQLEESTPKTNISVTKTPETTKKTVVTSTETKTISTGARKKVPQEKSKTKETTSKLSDDIKKFAMKLKKMQKSAKKPTFKTFKRSSKLGKKKPSPPSTKKVSSDPLRIRPRREDSPVEYIFIPLNPTPEELRLEQEREKLRQLAKKPTAEEIEKEKEKQRQRRINKTLASTTTISKTTVTKKPKLNTPKKKIENKKEKTSTTAIESSLNTLKKTKELGKTKLKEFKQNVQQRKEEKMKRKNSKSEEMVFEKKTEVTTKKSRDSPDYIFIPLKPDETSQELELPLNEEKQENIENIIVSKTENKDEESIVAPEKIVEKMNENKTVPDSEILIEEDAHIYEPISSSKEDEEDGLKSAIHVSNTGETLKLKERVSLKKKNALVNKKQGEEKTEEPEVPKQTEEQPRSDSRDENQEKWSKLTDHEYEPINPPGERNTEAVKTSTAIQEASPPVHIKDLTDLNDEVRTLPPKEPTALELRQLRIPLDDELVVVNTETFEFDTSVDRTSSPDTQATNLGTPATTLSSRTDGINTSQVDSAALEHLPVKKEKRKKKLMEMEEPVPQGPTIQDKLKTQAGKLKNKIKNIKKPTFTIPNPKFSPKFKRPKFERPKISRPKFQKPKFERPKFSMPSMPKMPDRPKINFPSFSIPRPGSTKPQQSKESRHISTTESSPDDSTNIFDFRTYPRLFDKSKKKSNVKNNEEPIAVPEFATVPRAAERKKGPVGARWVHRFTDIQFADEDLKKPATYSDELHSKDRGDSLERRMEADLRYEQALADDDEEMREYVKENQNISRHSPYHVDNIEYPERWRHGSFHRSEEFRNVRNAEDISSNPPLEYEGQQSNRDEHSSLASSGHQGVIEEIDSDQFFLREKGISQDNLQVGLYLSSEIRDAFRKPVNTLSQMERDYDSSPKRPKRKHLKKTKRIKKTPHASEEKIPFDQASINTEPEEQLTSPMTRPRRTKRPKILAKEESLETSQSEIIVDDENNLNSENLKSQENLTSEISNESIGNIIGYVEKDLDVSQEYNKYLEESLMYENEIMKNIERPEIIIQPDQNYEIERKEIDKYLEYTGMVETPKPPTRRHKSLKSLNLSEHDSILGEFNKDKIMQDILEQELNVYKSEHDYVIPDEDEPIAPRRTRSRSRTGSQIDDDRTSRGAESFITEPEEVCEPPCRQDLRDTMGYAIIDKSQKYREPPLPSTARRRRKFFTAPHAAKDAPPVRPVRNYSTLGPNKPPRRKSELSLAAAEEKENIDISQYIEIEDDEQSKDLQSGDIINKMKSRPLPAPPRPPRKGRDRSKEALRDITQQSNITSDISDYEKTLNISPTSPIEAVEEIEVSTQTDPLPDDFCCDSFVEEPTDRIVAPTRRKRSIHQDSTNIHSYERPKTQLEADSSLSFIHDSIRAAQERASSPHALVIERKVQTPVEDETITHASLLVRPVPEYPPDSFVNKRFGSENFQENINLSPVMSFSEREKILQDLELEISGDICTEESIPMSAVESSVTDISSLPITPLDTETIEEEIIEQYPEKPQRRKSQAQITQQTSQPQIIERIIERQVPVCVTPGPDTEVEVLRAQRLQVSELDVEKLNVSELQANKILVSEIDGVSLQISELTSKSGNLIVNGLEFPSGLIQEILDRLQSSQTSQQSSPSTEQVATQTSIEEIESNNTEFTETITEQVTPIATEPMTEQITNENSAEVLQQTDIEENDDDKIIHYSTQQDQLDENIDPDEFEELNLMPVMHAEQLEHRDSISQNKFIRLSTSSPTIIVDPPEPTAEEPEPEQNEEQDAIAQIRERIRFIEEEMSEFITDFTPTEMDEIKSEIESIIDIASEHVRSMENISEKDEDKMPDILLLSDSVDNVDTARENTEHETEKSVELCPVYSPDVHECYDVPNLPPLILSEIHDIPGIQETEFLMDINLPTQESQEIKSQTEPNLETNEFIDSIVPKEFHTLKSEQAQIIDNIQKQTNLEVQSLLENTEIEENIDYSKDTSKSCEESEIVQTESLQSKPEIQPTTPPRPPLPSHQPISDQSGQSIFHEVPYPLSYYPEYITSIPPASFYTITPHHSQDRSDEEVPVQHRRRRHHRHLSRSRSSSDERHVVSRRPVQRSPEPSIPQLTGQLAQAYSTVIARIIRQLACYIGSCLDTREGKEYLKIAMVILLVLIAGLILLGFGSGKTVHLHHWEYFNPPREL